jgi:hypothetical protein
VIEGEEKHPLAPVSYTEDDGRRRRLWTGLIPTGKRETYVGSPELPAKDDAPGTGSESSTLPNPALLLFWRLVSGPWSSLIDIAAAASRTLNPSPDDEVPTAEQRAAFVKVSRENIQTGSWYVLLDFAEFLKEQLPSVWAAITGSGGPALSTPEQQLVAHLATVKLPVALTNELIQPLAGTSAYGFGDIWGSLSAALAGIAAFAGDLDAIETEYDRTVRPNPSASDPQWPGSLFPLSDPIHLAGDATRQQVEALDSLVAAALPAKPVGPTPVLPVGALGPLDSLRANDRFVIRCIYERPQCAPVAAPVVSLPSEPFLLAGFFDPDAPARPVRIALPVDISPASLRKFDKNTMFMLSDALCGQVNRLKGLGLGDLIRSVLPWPLHKDLDVPAGGACCENNLGIGMAISLSLPIITICALLLLMIIVALLDIVFHWLPYFLFTYPCQLFNAKVKG